MRMRGDFENRNAGQIHPAFAPFPNPNGIESANLVRFNPNGIESISPGLRGTSYPGWTVIADTTPTGLRHVRRAEGHNPFRVEHSRVEHIWFTVSQGSSCLATLGWRTESLWDSRTEAPLARDLEQTSAGNVAEILEA